MFLPYARDYARTFRGKSIRTDQWKDHLYSYWSKEGNGGQDTIKILDSIDWDVRIAFKRALGHAWLPIKFFGS